MLTSSDLIQLPYSPDLSESGISYVCQDLRHAHAGGRNSSLEFLRNCVASVAVELAFRRYLVSERVPFVARADMPFSDPQHYDITLGGHRCKVISLLVNRRRQIEFLQKDPGRVFQSQARLPVEQFGAQAGRPEDLYLFAFLLGETAAGRQDVQKAFAAGRPVYLIHPLPAIWARPSQWSLLTKLALKSECEAPLSVEVGGQAGTREFMTVRLELPPRQRIEVEQTFYSLTYIHVGRPPEARLGLHSPVRGDAYLIQPHEWRNLHIQGEQILLAGWLTRAEFLRKARGLQAETTIPSDERMGRKNLEVPISELAPVGRLLEIVKNSRQEQSFVR